MSATLTNQNDHPVGLSYNNCWVHSLTPDEFRAISGSASWGVTVPARGSVEIPHGLASAFPGIEGIEARP